MSKLQQAHPFLWYFVGSVFLLAGFATPGSVCFLVGTSVVLWRISEPNDAVKKLAWDVFQAACGIFLAIVAFGSIVIAASCGHQL